MLVIWACKRKGSYSKNKLADFGKLAMLVKAYNSSLNNAFLKLLDLEIKRFAQPIKLIEYVYGSEYTR